MMKCKLPKIIYLLVCFLLIFEQSGFAQVAGQLDISGYFAGMRNILIQDKFRPLHLRYLAYDNLNNNLKLLLDKGDLKNSQTQELENTTKDLLNYFFVGISLPNDSFWVNLRPDSPDNIIDTYLAQTDLGKILLEADLQLKKDTANFTSPQTPEGKDYWKKLYQKANELFGGENITIPTLTRPWIVPGEIIIRETQDNAYIYKATLKVMLEQDYLKDSATYNFTDERLKQLNEYASELIRKTIIPKLIRDINTAKRYAPLRQVYYSLILAQWFKQKFSGKSGLYSQLINKKNLNGLTSKESWSKDTYFQAYQKSFKEGEYNIKEPVYTLQGQTIRNYMSGGIAIGDIREAIKSGMEITGNLKLMITLNHQITGQLSPGTIQDPYSGEINIQLPTEKTVGLSVTQESTSSPVTKPVADSLSKDLINAPSLIIEEGNVPVKLTLDVRDLEANERGGLSKYPGILFRAKKENTIYDVGFVRVVQNDKYIYTIVEMGVQYPKKGISMWLCVNAAKEIERRGGRLYNSDSLSEEGRLFVDGLKQKGFIKEEAIGGKIRQQVLPQPVASSPVQWLQIEKRIVEANGLSIKEGVVTANGRESVTAIDTSNIISRYLRVWNKANGKSVVVIDKNLKLSDELDSLRATLIIIKVDGYIKFAPYMIPFIAAMLNEDFYNKIVEDDGTGEGLLGLIALQLGAKRFIGIENNKSAIILAKKMLEEAGYKGVSLKASEWKSYIPKEEDQFILINDDLLTWYNTPPGVRENVAGGRLAIRLAELGPAYIKLLPYLLNDVLAYKNTTILGGYIEGEGKRLGMNAKDTIAVLKGYQIGYKFSAYVEKAMVFVALTVLGDGSNKSVSSPIAADSLVEPVSKGGIDFRALPITTQLMLNAPVGNILIPRPLVSINLDEFWGQIQNMLKAGIIPSSERIKEYLQACCESKDMNQGIDKVLACIADILRLQEERVISTDLSLKEMLALLESDKPANEMQLVLAKITVPEKEFLTIAQ